MDKYEELLESFESEINEVSMRELAAIEKEMEDVRNRTLEKLEQDAKKDADLWFQQEISEMDAEHAIALSHLNDDFNRRLMEERDHMVQSIFEEVKTCIMAFSDQDAYTEKCNEKLANLKTKGCTPATLYVRPADEKLLKSFLKTYELPCDGKLDAAIVYGGFRLECPSKGIIVDETIDTALQEAKQWFLQNSGLTIR